MLERHIEDVIFKYPELIEQGLTVVGRQFAVSGKRVDILCRDRHGYRLIIEIKRGTIARKDVAQLLDYEGYFVTPEDPRTRVMLVGNRVPCNLRLALDHHGFEWRELTEDYLLLFLRDKNDEGLIAVFVDAKEVAKEPETLRPANSARLPQAKGLPSLHSTTFDELSKTIRIRAIQCPTNYMDLLLLENLGLPLSTLIKKFHDLPQHAGSRDFLTVGRVKAHIKHRQQKDRWEFSVTGVPEDPIVRLTGLKR